MAVRYSERTGQPQEYQAGPFHTPHNYLQWGGKLPGGETWSCGLRMAPTSSFTLQALTAVPAAIVSAVSDFHGRSTSYIAAGAKLSFIKYNVIKTDGTYRDPGTAEAVVADQPGGGASSNPYPNQVALAVSLTTGYSRGPAHRGRFYLPLPTLSFDLQGQISATNAGNLKASAMEFIDALNAWTPNVEVVVMSRKSGAPAGRKVTGVEIGRILDTQRRRRKSNLEAYV